MGIITGCRESTPVTEPGRTTPIILQMTEGDTYLYDHWALDEYGYQVKASKQPELWRVDQTGIMVEGATGVTVIIDSMDTQHIDTLLLRSTMDGDIYQYGFIARLVKQMSGKTLVPQWDLIVRSGRMSDAIWPVGVADPAFIDTVYGRMTAAPVYFAAQVNGEPSAFPAYRVELSGTSVQFVFWVTDSPSCFPGFWEESTSLGNGFEAYLASAVIARR